MTKKTHKVFLSHNSRDKDRIEGIAQWLEKNGIEVWFDKWDVAPGTRWVQELEKGLDDCTNFLIFFGACGMGPWQRAEGGGTTIDNR